MELKHSPKNNINNEKSQKSKMQPKFNGLRQTEAEGGVRRSLRCIERASGRGRGRGLEYDGEGATGVCVCLESAPLRRWGPWRCSFTSARTTPARRTGRTRRCCALGWRTLALPWSR